MFSGIISVFSSIIHLVLGISTPQGFPPPLSAAEEKEHFLKAKGGDASSREKLILHNLRLVSHIVRKYFSTSPNQEDLISIGTIGLIKAIDSFKISNGARFATYAARCIQNEILMHFRAQKKLTAEVSLNETIDVDRDGNPLTYIDVIGCDDTLSTDVERKISSARAMRLVTTILEPKERRVIVLRYGLDGRVPMTQREVAAKLNISRSYVSRIEKSALEKLRAEFN